jgi:pimeloyl-ACP methyl ester carboxylesterase
MEALVTSAKRCLVLIILVSTLVICSPGQTTLSQGSGINANDTYVIFDMTVSNNGTFTASDPAVNSTSASISLNQSDKKYHLEAGYDSSGQMVINLTPSSTNSGKISLLRVAGGRVTAVDQNGLPVPDFVGATAVQWPQLQQFLRGGAGASALTVSNVQSFSQATAATSSSSSTSSVTYLNRQFKAGTGGTVTTTLQSSGATSSVSQIAVSTQTSNTSATRTTSFANVVWSDNTTLDAVRTGQPNPSAQIPAPTTTTPGAIGAAASSSCGPIVQTGTGQNIVFQHGIKSSCAAWPRMINWLNQDFQFGTEIAPSLSSFDGLANQGAALVQQIQSAGGSNYILLGHSQGGLVARSAAQYFQVNSPSTLQGVITLDTPNTGALIAQHGFQYLHDGVQSLAQKLFDDTGCVTPFDNFGCFLAALVFGSAPDLAVFGVQSGLPATFDNVPGSPFLTNLNSQPENFVRVGVIGNSQQRWLIARLLADALNGQPDGATGGRAIAVDVEIFYDVILAFDAIATVNAFFDCAPDGDPNLCAYDLQAEDFYTAILHGMDRIDSFWDNLVANPGDGSDGFIQSSSQNYSGAVNYPISDADSHAGATKSDKVRAVLDQTLNRQFFVPSKACSYTLSVSNLSVSPAGTTGTLTVETAAGCSWSVSSSVPWLTILSGGQGTGPGTVEFTISPNQSVARSVTLNIAGQTFTVNQGPGPAVWWPAIQEVLQ